MFWWVTIQLVVSKIWFSFHSIKSVMGTFRIWISCIESLGSHLCSRILSSMFKVIKNHVNLYQFSGWEEPDLWRVSQTKKRAGVKQRGVRVNFTLVAFFGCSLSWFRRSVTHAETDTPQVMRREEKSYSVCEISCVNRDREVDCFMWSLPLF